MTIAIIISCLGLGTVLLRISFLALAGHWELPVWVQRALFFVPVSMLMALIIPDLLYLQGSYDWSLANGRVIAALCAAFVAWKFKNVLLTMSVGMATLFAIQALFSA
jgi:branched-subunit amino acid transport protein